MEKKDDPARPPRAARNYATTSIDFADARARRLRLEADRAAEIVERLRALHAADAYADTTDEWKELERLLADCGR